MYFVVIVVIAVVVAAIEICHWVDEVALVVKNPPANAGDIRDMGSIPGLGGYLWRRACNPLQCSFPENPLDRGAWRAAVHGVAKSWTLLK